MKKQTKTNKSNFDKVMDEQFNEGRSSAIKEVSEMIDEYLAENKLFVKDKSTKLAYSILEEIKAKLQEIK